jgi:hypothetical protein
MIRLKATSEEQKKTKNKFSQSELSELGFYYSYIRFFVTSDLKIKSLNPNEYSDKQISFKFNFIKQILTVERGATNLAYLNNIFKKAISLITGDSPNSIESYFGKYYIDEGGMRKSLSITETKEIKLIGYMMSGMGVTKKHTISFISATEKKPISFKVFRSSILSIINVIEQSTMSKYKNDDTKTQTLKEAYSKMIQSVSKLEESSSPYDFMTAFLNIEDNKKQTLKIINVSLKATERNIILLNTTLTGMVLNANKEANSDDKLMKKAVTEVRAMWETSKPLLNMIDEFGPELFSSITDNFRAKLIPFFKSEIAKSTKDFKAYFVTLYLLDFFRKDMWGHKNVVLPDGKMGNINHYRPTDKAGVPLNNAIDNSFNNIVTHSFGGTSKFAGEINLTNIKKSVQSKFKHYLLKNKYNSAAMQSITQIMNQDFPVLDDGRPAFRIQLDPSKEDFQKSEQYNIAFNIGNEIFDGKSPMAQATVINVVAGKGDVHSTSAKGVTRYKSGYSVSMPDIYVGSNVFKGLESIYAKFDFSMFRDATCINDVLPIFWSIGKSGMKPSDVNKKVEEIFDIIIDSFSDGVLMFSNFDNVASIINKKVSGEVSLRYGTGTSIPVEKGDRERFVKVYKTLCSFSIMLVEIAQKFCLVYAMTGNNNITDKFSTYLASKTEVESLKYMTEIFHTKELLEFNQKIKNQKLVILYSGLIDII